MHNRFGATCRWYEDEDAASNMDSLQAILNCASAQGCAHCVKCSETALEMFLTLAQDGCPAPGEPSFLHA